MLDGHLADTTDEVHVLTDITKEGVGSVLRHRHWTAANDWGDFGTVGVCSAWSTATAIAQADAERVM